MGFQIENNVLVRYTEEPGVTRIIIPDNVAEIGERAFESCFSLKSVVILEVVMQIDDYAFFKCSSLTRVVILDSVTENR